MELSNGVDLLEIDFVKRNIDKHPLKFVSKVFLQSEIEYCENKINKYQHYAVRLAAKEATMKALGTGWTSKINFKMIEILNKENGQPFIQLHNGALDLFLSKQFRNINLSMSHSEQYAIAFVVFS